MSTSPHQPDWHGGDPGLGQNQVQPFAQPPVGPVTQPPVESFVHPVAQPSGQPVTQASAPSAVESAQQPISQQSAQPITDPAVPPAVVSTDTGANQASDSVIPLGQWQTTSAWTILQIFSDFLGAIVAYFIYKIVTVSGEGDPIEAIAEAMVANGFPGAALGEDLLAFVIEMLIPLALTVFPLIRWWSIRWRIDAGLIEFKQGLIWRVSQRMPRGRVQSVVLNATIIGRLTDTRKVVISSGDTEDITISLIPTATAEALRDLLHPAPVHPLSAQPGVSSVVSANPRPTDNGTLPADTPGMGAGQDGYTGSPLPPGIPAPPGVHPAQVMTAGQGAVGAGPITPRIDLDRLTLNTWIQHTLLSIAPHVMWIVATIFIGAIVAFFTVASFVDITAAIGSFILIPAVFLPLIPVFAVAGMQYLNTWGFTSWIEHGRVYTKQGLINISEKNAPLTRIQAVSVHQNPLRIWFKRDEVRITTADAVISEDKGLGETISLISPLLPAGQWMGLAQTLLGLSIPEELNPPSRLTIRRGMVRVAQVGLPIAGIIGLVEWYFNNPFYGAISALVLTVILAYPFGLWRYHNTRWAINDEVVVIRRGLLFRKTVIAPLKLIQNVYADATFFQRRLGLGDVQADLAGMNVPRVRAHDLPLDQAKSIEATLCAHAIEVVNTDGV